MANKYRLFLPKTTFSDRIIWENHQKDILTHWESINLQEKILNKNKNLTPFIVHLGPPYATGDLHKGHLLNYLIKNLAIRGFQNLGYNVIARQGWDCHGLPIEMKVEAIYNEYYKTKQWNNPYGITEDNSNNIIKFRQDCKNFANYWIDIQKESLKLLGFSGSIENYYTTMDLPSQQSIIGGFLKIMANEWVYRKKKVSMWSTVEKTTLSEAEIQYKDDHISPSIYFVTRVTKCPKIPSLENNFITIWTTTPWTLIGNNGYAYNNNLTYQWIRWGLFMFVAEKTLVDTICEKMLKIYNINTDNKPEVLLEFLGSELEGSLAEHPILKHDVPLVHGDFVGGVDGDGNLVGEKGTGIVHIAGAHGIDDFNLSLSHGMEIIDWVDENGYYIKELKDLGGLHALKEQDHIIEMLGSKLLIKEDYKHRYPYSERGKNPIIFKLSYQWFIEIDESNIRNKAIESIENVHWIPNSGYNRMLGMLKTRKEWVLSRQRWWGTPITWFFHKITGNILPINEDTPLITKKIMDIISKKTYDFWYNNDDETIVKAILPEKYHQDYLPAKDIMDVWFESGMSHDYVVRQGNKDIIADLYIEGSDQHRGWFQSSLLTSIALYNNAPYKTVLTHGFVLDDKKQKMSKSLGNVVSLRDCTKNIGCDVMALWVAMADFTEEITFNENIINTAKDAYTSIRNRCKFLLAVLNDYQNDDLTMDHLDPMDSYILMKIYKLHEEINDKIKNHQFRQGFMLLYQFCNEDLSKIYFVYSKDSLYCDDIHNIHRKNVIKIMAIILEFLIHHGKVFLPFLMEEVFLHYKTLNPSLACISAYLMDDFQREESWYNEKILTDMEESLKMSNHLMALVEKAIQTEIIKNKSEAIIITPNIHHRKILMELCKVSDIIEGPEEIRMTNHFKCQRCWNYNLKHHVELCLRCEKIEQNNI